MKKGIVYICFLLTYMYLHLERGRFYVTSTIHIFLKEESTSHVHLYFGIGLKSRTSGDEQEYRVDCFYFHHLKNDQ